MSWRYMGERRYSSTSLHLGSSWRLAASFTPLPFYPRGNSPRYLWIGGWVGSRYYGQEENLWESSRPACKLSRYREWGMPAPNIIWKEFISCLSLMPWHATRMPANISTEHLCVIVPSVPCILHVLRRSLGRSAATVSTRRFVLCYHR
jgi:hypothetical protein